MLDRVIAAARVCVEKTMVNSNSGENFVAAGADPKELVPPTFALDLDPNVRVGFDSTCDFIPCSHAALTTQIAQLATRIDAMGDATARAPVQPPPAAQPRDVVQCRPAKIHDHRPVCDTSEFSTNSKCPLCNPSQSQNHCCDLHNVVDITVIAINSK
jgi:hypothetical protein